MPWVSKNTTQRQFLFGDFDKDRVKNVDDPRPFNPKVSRPRETKKYYHRAQFIGGDVKLSTALLNWQKFGNTYRPGLTAFLHHYPGAEGRIKTVPSLMEKTRERYGKQIGDVAGARIISGNYRETKKRVRNVKRHYRTIGRYEDNFYKHPKDRLYYAHHVALPLRGGRRMEVQFMTHNQAALSNQMHPFYKRGMTPKQKHRFAEKAKRLFALDMRL